jgi:hypothetical protein
MSILERVSIGETSVLRFRIRDVRRFGLVLMTDKGMGCLLFLSQNVSNLSRGLHSTVTCSPCLSGHKC